MNSFTKYTLTNTKSSRYVKKVQDNDYFIYQYKLFSKTSVAFFKIAGGVGEKIYQYLTWKETFDGRIFQTLPLTVFRGKWGIRKQRINEALELLEAEGLVALIKKLGCKTRVKLLKPRAQLNGK